MPPRQDLLLLVDGHSLLHRAYHALPELTAPGGQPTGALYGFLTMMAHLLAEQRPGYLAVALDRGEPTFRHAAFAEYKAPRPPLPDALRSQVELLPQLLRALRLPTVDHPGAEADDVIGTLARRAAEQGLHVLVVTGDRDALQLVGPRVRVLLTRRGISDLLVMDESAVRARFGVPPKALVDVKALMGDDTDNIPGVPGVGEKTACRLIAQYGDLESLGAHLDEVQPPRLRGLLSALWPQVMLSRNLARIETGLDLGVTLEELAFRPPEPGEAGPLFTTLGFRSLFERFGLAASSERPSVAQPLTVHRLSGAEDLLRTLTERAARQAPTALAYPSTGSA